MTTETETAAPQLPDQIDIGTRIAITGSKHPWKGEAGTVEAYDTIQTIGKYAMRVKLDNGMGCYVFKQSDVVVIS